MGYPMTQPILELRDIHKSYDGLVEVLKGVSLEVVPSEVVVIIGPSGCGKSTLLRCINGLETVDDGEVLLDGDVVSGGAIAWEPVRQKIGMVFQSYELFPHLSVLHNLTLAPLKVKKEPRAEAEKRARQLLQRVGLGDREDAFPRELSGGQRQRVAIVRSLMMQPKVLLLDEVTASLDPEMVREVLDVIAALAEEGMTMVIVTHEMSFARAVADRVVFMDEGTIVESGSAEVFFLNPTSERARQFLDVLAY